jgi:ABC-2 type transport system ATP-binding protein
VDRAGLLVFASHSNELLKQLCTSALWMEHGTIRQQGPLEEVLDAYKGREHAASGG